MLLAAAGEELARYGYSGTGVGAIVERAGLTKGALFHHFPNKQALVAAWIGENLGAALEGLWLGPLGGLDSLDGLRLLCRARCLSLESGDALSTLVALTAETAGHDAVLGAALENLWAGWRAAVAGVMERAKAGGSMHRSIQAAVEAALLVASFAGFSVMSRGKSDEGLRRTCATALDGYLETLRAA